MKEDRRKKYTKMVLCNSFVELLNEKELSRITVTEICKKADVNRATYYAHYKDVYDQYESLTAEFLSKVCSIIENARKSDNQKDIVLSFCKFIKENKNLYIAVLGNSSLDSQVNLMKNKIIDDLLKSMSGVTRYTPNEYRYVFTCFLVGTNGLIYKWLTDNENNMTTEEIADLIYKMSQYGSMGII